MPNNDPLSVGKTDPIARTSPPGNSPPLGQPVGQPFSSFMQGAPSSATQVGKPTTTSSPFELAQGNATLGAHTPSVDSILTQVKQTQSTLGDLNSQINYPNLKLKPSERYLLKSKLSNANAHLRSANVKMGASIPEEPPATKFQGPLGKFIGYLTDGQAQMQSAQEQLQHLKSQGKNLTPGDFLLVQIKMNKAQQELEFSSVLLSNAVQAFKNLMQTQL